MAAVGYLSPFRFHASLRPLFYAEPTFLEIMSPVRGLAEAIRSRQNLPLVTQNGHSGGHAL